MLAAIAVTFYISHVASFEVSDATGVALAGITLVPAKVIDPQDPSREIPPYTRAQKFLFDYLRGKSNQVTLAAVDAGAVVFDPITYYIRKTLPASQQGRYQVLGAATQELLGATNFPNSAKLSQYYNHCVDRIEVGYGTSATSASEAVQSIVNFSSVLSAMPAALRNGEFILTVNSNVQIETPITDFGSKAAITGGGAKDNDGGELQIPKILPENLQIECDLNLATSQAIPNTANTTFGVEVLFKGVQARLRG